MTKKQFKSLPTLLTLAFKEDAVHHDATSQSLIALQQKATAIILAKQNLVLCGTSIAKEVFAKRDSKLKIKIEKKEGHWIQAGEKILQVQGKAQSLLGAERIALNFLQRLSGIATLTRQYVEQLKGTQAQLLDTRKTIPGFRELERYAVKTGGGVNHRFDLRSAIMVKDNHLALTGSWPEISQRLQKLKQKIPVIVEAETQPQLDELLNLGFDYIQLDNMNLKELRKSVQKTAGRAKLEATGGITLKNIRKVAQTGVDFISVGAITHSAPAVDISMEIKKN